MTLIFPSGSKGSLDIGVGAHEVSTAHSNIGLDPPSSCKGRLDIRVGGLEVPKAHSNIDFDSPCGCKESQDIGAGGPEVPKAHSNIALDSIERLQGLDFGGGPGGSRAFQHWL